MSGPYRSHRSKPSSAKPYARPGLPERQSSWVKRGLQRVTSLVWGNSAGPSRRAGQEGSDEESEEDVEAPPSTISPQNSQKLHHEEQPETPTRPSFARPPDSASSTRALYAPGSPGQISELSLVDSEQLQAPRPVTDPTKIQSLGELKTFIQTHPHPFNNLEKEGLVSVISRLEKQSSPFRFESVSRDVSPARSATPASVTSSSGLSRNPNGVLRYGGAGSSRLGARNRYRGSGFGSASPQRSPSISTLDTDWSVKRRRTEQQQSASTSTPIFSSASAAASSASLASGPNGGFTFRAQPQPGIQTPPPTDREGAPAPSPNRAKDSRSHPQPTPAAGAGSLTPASWGEKRARSPSPTKPPLFQLGTNGLPKTQPKQPSPLRQTFVAPGSPGSSEGSPSASRIGASTNGTETAKFMQNLLSGYNAEEKVEKGREEIRNPYQSALPGQGKRKRTKIPARKVSRSDNKEQQEQGNGKGKSKEGVSTQKLVEASVPKGSKRAKPPTTMTTSEEESIFNRRRSPRLSPPSSTLPLPSTTSFSALGAVEKKETGSSPKKNTKSQPPKKFASFDAPDEEEVDELDDDDQVQEASPPKKQKTMDSGAGIGLGRPSTTITAFSFTNSATTTTPTEKEFSLSGSPFSNPPARPKPSRVVETESPTSAPQVTSLFTSTGLTSSTSIFSRGEDSGSGSRSIFGVDSTSSSSSIFGSKKAASSSETDKVASGPSSTSIFGPSSSSTTTMPSLFPPPPSDDMDTSTTSTAPTPSVAPGATPDVPPSSSFFSNSLAKLASQPKVGSKLRHSFARAESESSSGSVTPVPPAKDDETEEDIKQRILASAVASGSGSKKFTFGTSVDAGEDREVKKKVSSSPLRVKKWDWEPTSSLGAFSMPSSSTSASSSSSAFASTSKSGLMGGSTTSSGGGFNWGAAGMKAPETKAGQWTCSTCMVPNPADKAKCVACETDKPSTSTSTSTPSSTTNGVGGGFNWGATASGSSSSTSGGGFNWSAAGMKAPEKKVGQWECPVCMVSNPADKFKCVACETDKPSSATSTSTPAPTTNGTGGFNWGAATGGSGSSSGSGGGFNWSAAGMKAPETKPGQWNCSTCMVPNPATALKCVACETDKPSPSLIPSSSTPSAVTIQPSSAFSSGGFNWAAAGVKPPTFGEGEWSCSDCLVMNKPDAVKCASCEADKPTGLFS